MTNPDPATDPSGPLAGLHLMHVGLAVADLETSMAFHSSAVGIGPWAVSVPIDFTSYDG